MEDPPPASQPLLSSEQPSSSREYTYASTGDEQPRRASSHAFSEVWTILYLSLPISLSELLGFGSTVLSTSYVGRLGATELSAWTLARTMFHISGLALVTGLASGQVTFSGQAYGAGAYRSLGVHMQRVASVSLLVAAASVASWWWGSERIFHYLRQSHSLIQPASDCLRIMAPSLFLRTIQVTIKNYFACQAVVLPQTIVTAKVLLATPAINQLMIHRLGYGLKGAAYAYNILTVLEVGLLVLCVVGHHFFMKRFDPERCTWGGWALRQAVMSWGPFLRIALPSCAMVCLNWWSFEVMNVIAGLQDDAATQLGANGCLFATHSLAFMVASGFGGATATRVANELGAGFGSAARHAVHVAVVLGIATATAIAVCLTVFRRQWADFYVKDEVVAHTVTVCMPLLSISLVFDSVNVVLSGLLRGCGFQVVGFITNLSTFFAVGLPLAAFLDLPWGLDRGVYGIWVALALVSGLQAAALSLIAATFNYQKLVRFGWLLVGTMDRDKGHHAAQLAWEGYRAAQQAWEQEQALEAGEATYLAHLSSSSLTSCEDFEDPQPAEEGQRSNEQDHNDFVVV